MFHDASYNRKNVSTSDALVLIPHVSNDIWYSASFTAELRWHKKD